MPAVHFCAIAGGKPPRRRERQPAGCAYKQPNFQFVKEVSRAEPLKLCLLRSVPLWHCHLNGGAAVKHSGPARETPLPSASSDFALEGGLRGLLPTVASLVRFGGHRDAVRLRRVCRSL